jgi:hypothetical protein
MEIMTTETNRSEFEEWAKRVDLSVDKRAGGYHNCGYVTTAWEAWQAARERQNQELSAARKALFEISEMDYDEGDIWDQAEKIQAIAHNAYYHPPTSRKNENE